MHAAQLDLTMNEKLLARLVQARTQTDDLFNIVRPDSLYERPVPERHRIIFYLGHLEAFDWNLLHQRAFGVGSSQTELDRLFAFGIDPVDGGLPSDKPGDWPSLDQVRQYDDSVRQALGEGFKSLLRGGGAPQVNEEELSTLLNVAIEHRLMHAETLAYMFHQLPADRKISPARATLAVSAPPVAPRMVDIPAGSVTLGLSRRNGSGFGWDNEYEQHSQTVPAFAIDEYKVTNGEYLWFVAHGGYENESLWTADDWKWKTENNITRPLFWKQKDNGWFFSTMFGQVPLPLEWPVYISHAEASAYARWAGKALPTEAQWHRAAFGSPWGEERAYPWGNQPPGPDRGNFDFVSWDPMPVNAFSQGRSLFGVADMLGNGWEWTSTRFEPFLGFQPFSFYPGYSANFFDGRHFVVKGASARTAACMLRRSFRNWFQPHYPYVYAACRCVSN